MFDRENIVGLLLVALCGAAAVIMTVAIVTGQRLRWTGPTWLAVLLGVIFFGALIYGMLANRRRSEDGSPAWPDPRSGQKGGWRRWFRRGGK
ncbi:MAG: hypothetical protein ACR2LS_06680 [Thermomicrobiales bacterium]